MSLLDEARKLGPELVRIRREIHMNPELGTKEHRTSGLVRDYLLGLQVPSRRLAGTGVLAVLEGGSPGGTVLLRADMDALPIQDRKSVSYASRVPNCMHACGHDGHVACLLGAVNLLIGVRPFPGRVVLAFQPAEEGPGGAEPMIRDGAMDDPRVDACFALHLETEIETGSIGVNYGSAHAAADSFEIVVKGEGGHGAEPHRAVDAIVAAAHVVTALQTIVSRETGPLESVVVSVGTINGGYRENVIADKVVMTGTLRTLTPWMREQATESVRRTARGAAAILRAECDVIFHDGYPPLVNDREMTDLVRMVATGMVGHDKVKVFPVPSMGAEDFGYFLQRAPGSFFKLGAGSYRGCQFPGHHAKFDFDERALPVGAAMLASVALEFLGREV